MDLTANGLKLNDGTNLNLHYWDTNEAKATILLVHGFAEHGARYAHFAAYLNQNRVSLRSFDLRGHGRSGGKRAYIDRFSTYLDDLHQVVEHFANDKPVFLMGHSMGGLIATRYCQLHPKNRFEGLILSGPALKLDDDLSPLLLKIIPILSRFFPAMPTQKLDKQFISRDAEVVRRYDSDPLNYRGGMRARTGAELIRTISGARQDFGKLSLPLLILHGGADKLTDPAGSQKLFEEANSADKQLEIFENCYHELVNEPEKDKIMETILGWVEKRSA